MPTPHPTNPRRVVPLGNVSGTATLNMAARESVLATLTLTADTTLDIVGMSAGDTVELQVLQNPTGGWSLSLTQDGTGATEMGIDTTADALSIVTLSHNGTDIAATFGSPGSSGSATAVQSAGALVGPRTYLNFGDGISVTDNSANDRLDVRSLATSVYHVKRDGGALGDGSTADDTAINTLIASCSLLPGITRIDFGSLTNSTYLLDTLYVASNVWLNLGNATLKKRIDHGTSIIRALETGTATTRTTTGTTTNGSPTVSALGTPASVVAGRAISGTGIPNGTTILSVDFTANTLTLSANATASGTVTLTVSGNTYYGTYQNIAITGGTLDANNKTCSHLARLFYVDNLTVEGLYIPGYAADAAWALAVGGRNGKVSGVTIEGGSSTLQDGIHLAHGQRWAFSDCTVGSGDDAFVLGSEPTDPYLSADPDPIQHVTGRNMVVNSAKGNGFKAYVSPNGYGPNYKVTDFDVQVTGRAGTTRNGGVVLTDFSHGAGTTSAERQIKRGRIRTMLELGTGTHDATNANGVWMNSVEDCKVLGVIEMPAAFKKYYLRDTLKCETNVSTSSAATYDITTSPGLLLDGQPYEQAGAYVPDFPLGAVTVNGLTASQRRAIRHTVKRPMKVTKIGFTVTTAAGTDDTFDVGIFSGDCATLLASSGAVTGASGSVSGGGLNSTGAKVVTLSSAVQLYAGQNIYVAISTSTFGGSAAQLKMINTQLAGGAQNFGATAGTIDLTVQSSSAHPLAAPLTISGTSVGPCFVLRTD